MRISRICLVWLSLALGACVGTAFETSRPGLPPGGLDGGDRSADAGAPFQADGGGTRSDAGSPAADAGPAAADAGAPLACGSLSSRVSTVLVSVAPATVDVGSGGGWSNNRPVHLAPLSGGRAKVAWSSSDGTVHVTSLDASLSREAPDVVVPGVSVRGFVAHEGGAVAMLVVRGYAMVLVRLLPSGLVDFEQQLVGDAPNATTPNTRWVDSWGHEGRLRWTGANYLAYFGHTKYWGAQGKHQGDRLLTLSPRGAPAGGPGWDWGCSHSLDVRLAWDGQQAAPVCVSDCYSSKAVLLSNSAVLVNEPSGNCGGSSDGELGGLAALPQGGFAFTFSSKEGRTSRDIGFLILPASGPRPPVQWLTTSTTVDEHQPGLALYGSDRLLAAWQGGAGTEGVVMGLDGGIVEGPAPLALSWAQKDELVTWPEGDVGVASGGGAALTISRVRACKP